MKYILIGLFALGLVGCSVSSSTDDGLQSKLVSVVQEHTYVLDTLEKTVKQQQDTIQQQEKRINALSDRLKKLDHKVDPDKTIPFIVPAS